MEIFITLTKYNIHLFAVKKVTTARGDYFAYSTHLTKVSNIFVRNGIYTSMFTVSVYKSMHDIKTGFAKKKAHKG